MTVSYTYCNISEYVFNMIRFGSYTVWQGESFYWYCKSCNWLIRIRIVKLTWHLKFDDFSLDKPMAICTAQSSLLWVDFMISQQMHPVLKRCCFGWFVDVLNRTHYSYTHAKKRNMLAPLDRRLCGEDCDEGTSDHHPSKEPRRSDCVVTLGPPKSWISPNL